MKKITRRTVLRASGLAAASLALSGCASTGSACVGNGFSDWLQQTFGFISLGSSDGSFIVQFYPVSIHPTDVVLVLATVIVVGFASVWYPVKFLSRKFLVA